MAEPVRLVLPHWGVLPNVHELAFGSNIAAIEFGFAAVTSGRVAVVYACRGGIPAFATPDSVHWSPERSHRGPSTRGPCPAGRGHLVHLVVVTKIDRDPIALVLTAFLVRRYASINGDVLCAAVEIAAVIRPRSAWWSVSSTQLHHPRAERLVLSQPC